MAKIYQELKLDVLKANNAIKIQAKQNDVDSRYLKVTVTEEGKPIDLSGFTSVQINVKRDDGENEAFAGEISEGVVIVPIPSWALEVAGYASCDISMLNGEGEILTTLSFRLYIERSNYKRDITPNDPNYTAFEKALIDIESLKSGGGSSGGGFRKIGFTEDCDFVATTEDGLSAFRNALDAATDGETFFVMSGVYKGADTLTIAKNLNFIGVGMPTIEFPISVYGEGEFDFGTGDIITPIVTYATNWSGIHFANTVKGFQAQNYRSPLAYSAVNSENCIFEGLRNRFVGNHFQSKLIFECVEEWDTVSLGSGFEPAEGCVFESCDLIFRNPFTEFIKAENCNIFFETSGSSYAECSYIFENCNVYNYGGNVLTNGQYVETFVVTNCSIFGTKFFSGATASGNYLFSGTAL